MCSTLSAIGHLNTYIASIYSLLEASIENYFRTSSDSAPWHAPSWQGLMEALSMSLPKLTPVQPKPRQQPAQHIKSLLNSYEKIVENPIYVRVEPIQSPPIDGSIMTQLKKRLNTFNSTAK